MLKHCSNCRAEYVARWRNEETTLCPDCRVDVVLCAMCGALIRPPIDAAQLTLFPFAPARRQLPPLEPHYSHGRLATQAEKRRQPYH